MHVSAQSSDFFPVWKTISVDKLVSRHHLKHLLVQRQVRMSDWLDDIFDSEALSPPQLERNVDLVAVTPGELGFSSGGLYADVVATAARFGLGVCTPIVGPYLRLQYPEQPSDEYLKIAMRPIVCAGEERIFEVVRDPSGLWLLWTLGGLSSVPIVKDRKLIFVDQQRKAN